MLDAYAGNPTAMRLDKAVVLSHAHSIAAALPLMIPTDVTSNKRDLLSVLLSKPELCHKLV